MALLADVFDHARQLVQAVLTVIGATIIGAFAVGIFGNYVSQTLTSKKLNSSVLRFVRILGGLSTGFVVSMLVFNGSGGWGLGGGSGSGSAGMGLPKTDQLVADKDKNPVANSPSASVGVTILGGVRVVAEKFYQVDGNARALTLTELQALVKSVQPTGPGHLTLRIYDDSVAQDHPAVVALENWLRDQNWRVTIEKIPGALPNMAGEKS